MKVLATLTSWISDTYVSQIVDNYESMTKYKVDVVTEINKHSKNKNELHAWSLHSFLANNYQNYDLIINQDDDILITETNLDYYVNYQSLDEDYIPGFLLYEEGKGKKQILHMRAPQQFENILTINNEKYIIPLRKHSAFFVADKDRYEKYLSAGYGITPTQSNQENIQSMARTEIYTCGVFTKVIHIQSIIDNTSLAKHIPDKFASQYDYQPILMMTPENFIKFL